MSELNPIYVYNKHKSPVSALCFGSLYDQAVIVTGTNDGELHVWDLTNFTTLINIQFDDRSKIVGLESIEYESVNEFVVSRSNQQPNTHKSMNNDSIQLTAHKSVDAIRLAANEQATSKQSNSKSRNELQFISQQKNGQLKFIHLFNDDEIIKFKVYKLLQCSDCTFCPFQVITVGTYLFLVYISPNSNGCVNLLVMNGGLEIVNKRIVEIDQNYGIISSMKLNRTENGLILLAIGTETGCCLVYASDLRIGNQLIKDKSNDEPIVNDERTAKEKQTGDESTIAYGSVEDDFHLDESTIDALSNGFRLKFKQDCFKNTFISSVELNDSNRDRLQLICGSVEDCLAIVNLEIQVNPSDDRRSSQDPHARKAENSNSLQGPLDGAALDAKCNDARSSKKETATSSHQIQFKTIDKPVKYLKITNKGKISRERE